MCKSGATTSTIPANAAAMNNEAGGGRRRGAVLVAIAVAVVNGCGAGADAPYTDARAAGNTAVAADSAEAGSISDTAMAAPTGEDDPASPWTVQDTRVNRDVDGLATLTELRTARHEGFDRVVLEFAGAAVPGYSVAWIDRPVRQCGSGHTVALDGDGWLEIEVMPARAHTDAGRPTVTERSRRPDLGNVQQLELTCDFEGHVVWVAGVSSPAPYRVLELRSPARLVIDVRHDGGS